jgi:hypothetical protein
MMFSDKIYNPTLIFRHICFMLKSNVLEFIPFVIVISFFDDKIKGVIDIPKLNSVIDLLQNGHELLCYHIVDSETEQCNRLIAFP